MAKRRRTFLGYELRDEGGGYRYPPETTREEAIRDWHASFERPEPEEETSYGRVTVAEVWVTEDGSEEYEAEESVELRWDPEEPECEGGEHEWERPHDVVGGDRQNPGCFGHGGGLILVDVCRHCGWYRERDTWHETPELGGEPREAIRYRPPDEVSLRWAHAIAEEEMEGEAVGAETFEGWAVHDEGASDWYDAGWTKEEVIEDWYERFDRPPPEEWTQYSHVTVVEVWKTEDGTLIDKNKEVIELRWDPEEPECEGERHEWEFPLEVVGGIPSNPGCFAQGGGVVLTAVCRHCGWYRVTDTSREILDLGGDRYEVIQYRPPDERSLAWVEAQEQGEEEDEG